MGIFKQIKRKSKEPSIKICPQCHEPTLRKNFTGQWANVDYYECTNCDYKGSFYLEVNLEGKNAFDDSDLQDFQNQFPDELKD